MAKILNAFRKTEEPNPPIEDPKIINMKRKVELLHKGFIVHVKDVYDSDEDNNFLVLKVTLSSSINHSPAFGEILIKIAKQAVPRLKTELNKVI
jgi:hypothetical protein